MAKRFRLLAAFVVIVGAICLPASPASAGYKTFYDSGFVYHSGGSGANRACAWWGQKVDVDHTGNRIRVTASTAATKGADCATTFTLPHGWLDVNVVVQFKNNGVWEQAAHSINLVWLNEHYGNVGPRAIISYPIDWTMEPGRLYRVVTGHSALMNGAVQQHLQISPEFLLT